MQSDSMSDGQDISLQGAYRQDQGAKLEVKPTEFSPANYATAFGMVICVGGLFTLLYTKSADERDDDEDSKKWWR